MQLKSLLFPILTVAFLAGCGGGDPANPTPSANKLAASSTCLSCHASVVSPTTGALIGDEWRSSVHNLKNGAGCADCHEPASDHPNACSTCHGGGLYQVTKNPDQAGKCYKCHGPAFPGDALMALAPQHFGYSSARALPKATRASYVSGQYQGRCGACHNPHNNTLTQQHRDYATSLHGDPKGAAWNHYEFKGADRVACQRCHTSTGYISYVTSGFTVPTKGFGAGDPSRELLACDACHASYDFKNSIRKVPAFTAPYKNFAGAAAAFPDTGETSICIPCHSGLDSGPTIAALPDASFSNVGFVNPHYMAAAGLMYMQNGFTNFTSAAAAYGTSTYGKSLSPDSASTPGGITGGTTSTHRKLGTAAINNDSHKPAFFKPGVLDQNGPCVTCHLNASGVAQRSGSGHSLKIDGNAFTQVCSNCHPSENTVPLTADNFRENFVLPQAEAFESSLKLMETILRQKYLISFDVTTYPYFYDENLPLVSGKKQAVKDWTRSAVLGTPANGRKLMGACFNFNLLTRDPAAYAHARSYSRRLVYDSLDFLDNGVMDLSVGSTAKAQSLLGTSATNAVFGLFTQGAKAYNDNGVTTGTPAKYGISTPYPGTSEAMLYLIAWNRSGTLQDPTGVDHVNGSGSWAKIERP
jgi:hypothetical protein